MTVAVYARVSTNDKGQDTENQLRELREFAAQSGFTIYKEYIDQETASGKRTREQFDLMFVEASRLKFRAVLCWALDRLSREGIGPTFRYIEKLKDYGVDFISFREPHFRTTGEAGSLMLAMAAWLAEQERKRLGDRTRAGMMTARLKGKRLGRPVAVVDIARVRQLHIEGQGVGKISKALTGEGCKVSRETIRRLLKQA